MRRSLLTIAVLIGVLAGGLTFTTASAAVTPPVSSPTKAVDGNTMTAVGPDGCRDAADWWAYINNVLLPVCETNLDWPWTAGEAKCSVISNDAGVPELVNCTGTVPEENGPIACYINVKTQTNGALGTDTTVCTSSKSQLHRDTINASMNEGGKEGQLMFGCTGGDGMCYTLEGWSRALASDTVGTLVTIVSTSAFSVEGPLWDAVDEEWSYWVWAVLGIMFAACTWAITAAIYSRDRADMVSAIVRAFVGFPMTLIAYWLGSHLIGVFDEWTLYTLSRGESIAEVFRRFSQILYAGGEGDYFMNFLITLISWVGAKLLNVVFALRTLGLAVLMMAAPVAWMMFAVKNIGVQWVVRWASAGFTLLIAGPLTMGFVMLLFRGLGNLDVLWSPDAWPLLLGLVLTVFAPFAVMNLFSFAGAAAADGLGGAVGHAGRATSSAARSSGRAASTMARKTASVGRSGANRPSGVLPNGQRGTERPPPAGRSNSAGRTDQPKKVQTNETPPARQDRQPASSPAQGGPVSTPAGKK